MAHTRTQHPIIRDAVIVGCTRRNTARVTISRTACSSCFPSGPAFIAVFIRATSVSWMPPGEAEAGAADGAAGGAVL